MLIFELEIIPYTFGSPVGWNYPAEFQIMAIICNKFFTLCLGFSLCLFFCLCLSLCFHLSLFLYYQRNFKGWINKSSLRCYYGWQLIHNMISQFITNHLQTILYTHSLRERSWMGEDGGAKWIEKGRIKEGRKEKDPSTCPSDQLLLAMLHLPRLPEAPTISPSSRMYSHNETF